MAYISRINRHLSHLQEVRDTFISTIDTLFPGCTHHKPYDYCDFEGDESVMLQVELVEIMTNIPFTNPGLLTPNHRASSMQMQASSINDVNLLDLASEVGYKNPASSLVVSCRQYGNILTYIQSAANSTSFLAPI